METGSDIYTITLSTGGGTTLSIYGAIPDLILNVPSLRGVVIQRLEGISGVYGGERDGGGVGTECKLDTEEVGTGARRVARGCPRVSKEARHGPAMIDAGMRYYLYRSGGAKAVKYSSLLQVKVRDTEVCLIPCARQQTPVVCRNHTSAHTILRS